MDARPAHPELVFAEPDPAYHLALSKTRSERYLLMYSHSEVTMYAMYLAADSPEGEPLPVNSSYQGSQPTVACKGAYCE